MNKVELTGRLAADPKLVYSQKGTAISNFTIAVSRRFANKDGEREADFISCVAWGKTAEFVGEYFKKGKWIEVSGRVQSRNYEAQDGTRRYVTEIVVDEAGFVGDKVADKTVPEHTKEAEKPVQDNSYEIGLGEYVQLSDDELARIFGEQ